MKKLKSIPFSKIPVKSQLYQDYIAGNPKLSKFYSGYHRNEDDFHRITKSVVKHDYNRLHLAEVLRGINEKFGITPAIEANLELLKHDQTVTVITGQQAGIYTGPLYTILKAITTIKAATHLSKMLNRPVVPLFWMESSDHDLGEVNHIYFPGLQGPVNHVYGKDENPKQQSVGSINLMKDFIQFSDKIKKNLPQNDFYDAVTRLMDETYYPGTTFGDAFGKMMSRLLGRFGLIMVDAENVDLKRLAAPIIVRKLQDRGRMNELLIEQSEELEREDYQRQIQVRTELLNLFILKDNNRVPLSVLGDVLANGESNAIFESRELVQIASENPERFSPKVAFRPIVQDFLFPTIAYIGGPSELAYFAQLKKVYEFFEIQMPIIWPRTSASLFDAKIQRHIIKIGITHEDVFRNPDDVVKEITNRHFDFDIERVFATADEKLDDIFVWLRDALIDLDPTLAGQLQNPEKKMLYQLNHIKARTHQTLQSKQKNLTTSYYTVRNQIFPNKKLQERVYNVLYYLSRYGFWLMDFMMEELDIEDDCHQILEIPS
ncbi:MAG: bacillithiol biosynthesis cysteine-adding enzyme BshC [FCB group bacterium]|nr:bacillithiol biosynthesis cysteine-adding enzyme BshC [FCB group bacterium]